MRQFRCRHLITYVAGKPITASELPPDLDTTSIGLTVIQPDDRVVNEVLDEILQYVTPDGMAMVNTCHPLVTHTSANPPATDLLRCRAAIHRSHRFSQRPLSLLLARPRARTSKDTRLVARPTRAPRLLGRHAVLRDGRVLPLLLRAPPSQHARRGAALPARTALACARG